MLIFPNFGYLSLREDSSIMKIKKNICIITTSLGEGGAQKVAATQSIMLDERGYNVFIVSFEDKIEFEYSGNLLNLGKLSAKSGKFFNVFIRAKMIKKYLKSNNIDLIIDHRSRLDLIGELFLKYFVLFGYKKIFVIHSRNLPKSWKSIFLSRIIYNESDNMVSVSKKIKAEAESVYKVKEIKIIHNSFPRNLVSMDINATVENEYILFFGRLEENAKNISFLIKSYSNSELPKNNIKLVILGDGPDKQDYIQLVDELNLGKYVEFIAHRKKPFSLVKDAMFTVLTSNFEGFPLSLIESLACETPVVSVDCESGPREIVKHGFNGLLVEKKMSEFTNALNKMAADKALLAFCENNCLKSIEHLSFESIKNEWGEFITAVLDSNKK